MARSRSGSRHTNGSRGTQLVANGNGPNGAPAPSIQPAASARSGEDLRAQLTTHRSSGALPPPPVAPAPARALIQEGVAVFEQASTALARVAASLRAEEQAELGATRGAPASPPPPPTRGSSGPSTRPPQVPITQGEVNSPRPSERRGGGDSRRGRQRDDDGRAPTQTRPALERLGDHVSARDRLGPRPANGSRGTQLVANGNGPNRAPAPSIQPAASTRSREDLRTQLTNHRGSGAPSPPPVAPAPARALIQEGVAVFEQDSTALARVAAGLRAEEQADLSATRGRSGPSTRPPQAPITQGEVNSPRPSERRGGGDSRRGRQRDGDGRAPTQTRPALERLGDHVSAWDRLGPRPANGPPAEESCSRRPLRQESATRRSLSHGPRAQPRHEAASRGSAGRVPRPHPRREQASRVERSGETNDRAPSSHRVEVEQLRRRMDEL
ncbi:PREDICTED: uncharacterized protein LOC109189934 [Ipomoea nil]|uniref:uncharacterized protein LOC109189934 n=1 Tax=Ipomoea nil TaxID=35883 RepID=UPI000901BD7A|nr:PREDICTED: uncharacterized protein LOC109189934 [Ipomoea nil]